MSYAQIPGASSPTGIGNDLFAATVKKRVLLLAGFPGGL
jgi:hypothetical protein